MAISRKTTGALLVLATSMVVSSAALALSGKERQLTTDPNGYILTNLNVFSPDNE